MYTGLAVSEVSVLGPLTTLFWDQGRAVHHGGRAQLMGCSAHGKVRKQGGWGKRARGKMYPSRAYTQ